MLLGKETKYITEYSPELLYPIARKINRKKIGITDGLPFKGYDIWNAFELSWLNKKGKPIVAIGEFIIPALSPNLIESKSLKLYLNSFNNTKFSDFDQVVATLVSDLSKHAGVEVIVKIFSINDYPDTKINKFNGLNLDELDVNCEVYQPNPEYLFTEEKFATETVYSNLLKSNCPVTSQPDWGSVQISYSGKKINYEGLLKYIVSFRNHNEFHEQCIERIFVDIINRCSPDSLTVYGRYTRRGGLDINPVRSTDEIEVQNIRLCRQ